ncbi:MAG: putative DNA binding domain-containing protein [Desulfobacula sp.]|uniref:RNA-binding domain-containing protein n=1 Tax=Desulfobacula sp. TaxID=2593537 RepID=UPI0025B85A68|nr:RNA-binding domain-containing protein [Desulfobacula sp.]MCD4720350.1 putative DNA binding domain-containing protein [Desulfobacula sp.]
MDFKNLKESRKVEFKSSFGKEVIITLVAFANTRGGKVILGLDDKGTVKGIELGSETEQKHLNDIKTSTYPQLLPHSAIYEVDGKTILVLEINEYPVKPVAYKNRYYKRVKNSNHMLSLEEIVDLRQQSLDISFDAHAVDERLSDLDTSLMEKFIEKVNSKGRISLLDDMVTNMTKLKFIKSGKSTLAGTLLFGNHGYSIHIGRFKAEDTIIDDLLIKAPLLTALEEAMIFIKKHINLSYEFDGSLERKEVWQYPLDVIREFLLNAVVHRDYKHTTDIVIKIFDNRIIFSNPGTLFGKLTLKDLEKDDYTSSIRNKIVAEAFFLTGDIEKYGTGFIRIRKKLNELKTVTYKISEIGDFFRVELLDARSYDLGKDPVNGFIDPVKEFSDVRKDVRNIANDVRKDVEKKFSLSKNQILILKSIQKDRNLTQENLSEIVGITLRNIQNNMKKLKEIGALKRVGSTKSGYWKILWDNLK